MVQPHWSDLGHHISHDPQQGQMNLSHSPILRVKTGHSWWKAKLFNQMDYTLFVKLNKTMQCWEGRWIRHRPQVLKLHIKNADKREWDIIDRIFIYIYRCISDDDDKQLIKTVQDFQGRRARWKWRRAPTTDRGFIQTVIAVASPNGTTCATYHRMQSSNLLQIKQNLIRGIFATCPVDACRLSRTTKNTHTHRHTKEKGK